MIGLFSYSSDNIGDDFQSLIMRRWLGYQENEVVHADRDKLISPNAEHGKVDLVINAFIGGRALPIHNAGENKITPYFVAVHLHYIDKNGEKKLEQLRKYAPIGCRDEPTLRRCQERNIPSYYSGCPTILCERADVKEDIDVLLVDVNPRVLSGIPEKRVQYASNMIPKSTPANVRREICLRRWEMISRSRLVVTSKLHAAMPALAMGRPVIFIREKIVAPGRLTSFPKFFRTYKIGEKFSWDPDAHRYDMTEYRNQVESKLIDRIGHLRKK
ncbi:MAG: polysaccharide pyruvyl transferase family protein [Verrucomicrobia bacterium]|nr:polysaccharide pyruvyl transferase family protein [Verrucomicrobiota bacterium]